MSNNLIAWAVPKLSNILPLDEDSLKQIVDYSAGLSKEESAEHLKNLLGDSPQVLEFISTFNSRRPDSGAPVNRSDNSTPRSAPDDGTRPEKNQAKKNKRAKVPPLHNAGPARRPENYGDVTGAYKKADQEEDYMSSSATKSTRGAAQAAAGAFSEVPSLSSNTVASLQPLRTDADYGPSSATSRTQSPARKTNARPPPSAAGPLISEYLPNVKSKTAKPQRHVGSGGSGSGSGHSTPAKGSVTTTNIADLTSAIAALEVSTNPTNSKNRQKCDCNASIHPLFAPAPNCLSCGKIICSLEGLQPCSFCGAPLLSSQDIQSMIKELREERGQEKMRVHNESVHHTGGPGFPDKTSPPSKLDAAVAHRNKLLAFQAQNAQRTRVVDEAADFETPNVGSTQWMSPAQRALALKKQQRILREMEEKARPEWEKKQAVISLDIKSGRVVRTYQTATPAATSKAADDEELDETAAANVAGSGKEGAAFSHNPLLASGGLLRPIWKSSVDAETAAEGPIKETRHTWRRVQDDNDDNEQWILDGGTHGFGHDSGA